MSRFVGEGKRTPEPGPLPELPAAIERLTVTFRELTGKRDRLEGDVNKLRRRVAEAEAELDQLQLHQLELSWRPPQLAEQRLEQYRDKLRAHLAVVRRDRKSTRLNSSHVEISYAVFCLKKKKKKKYHLVVTKHKQQTTNKN